MTGTLTIIDRNEPHYVLFTDGSCLGNTKRGGWAALVQLVEGGKVVRQQPIVGDEDDSTNNRMEVTAALEGLKRTKELQTPVLLSSDSQYLIKGVTEWLPNWKVNGWRTSDGSVKNVFLWQALDELIAERTIEWQWVRGHAGNRLNEMVDGLAKAAARGLYRDKGSLFKARRSLFL